MVATNRHRRADGSVPLSVDIIALAQTLQAYQEWVRLAVQIDPKLKGRSWYRASEGYFSRRLGEVARAAGLRLNRATFDSLSTINWPREVLDTPHSALPQRYRYHPSFGSQRVEDGQTLRGVPPRVVLAEMEAALRAIVAQAPSQRPEEEDGHDTESADDSRSKVDAWCAAERAREGLRLAGRPVPAPGEASEVVADRAPLLRIDVLRDNEAKVFVARSPDLRGLVAEAETLDDLVVNLHSAVNDLLLHNRGAAVVEHPRPDPAGPTHPS